MEVGGRWMEVDEDRDGDDDDDDEDEDNMTTIKSPISPTQTATNRPEPRALSPEPSTQNRRRTMPNAQESHGIFQHGPGGIVPFLVLVGDVTMDEDLARFST